MAQGHRSHRRGYSENIVGVHDLADEQLPGQGIFTAQGVGRGDMDAFVVLFHQFLGDGLDQLHHGGVLADPAAQKKQPQPQAVVAGGGVLIHITQALQGGQQPVDGAFIKAQSLGDGRKGTFGILFIEIIQDL